MCYAILRELLVGIQYKKRESGKCVIGFLDVDWAGDVNGRKSTSGHLLQMIEEPFHDKVRNKTQTLDIKHHFIHEQVANNNVELRFCPSNEMVADLFTKGLA